MVETQINLSYVLQPLPPRVTMVQGDSGRTLKCNILDYQIPSSARVRLKAKKPDGKLIYIDATRVDSSTVNVAITNNLLAVAGLCQCNLECELEGTVNTFTFNITIQPVACSDEAIESTNELSVLKKATEEAKKQTEYAKAQGDYAKNTTDTEKQEHEKIKLEYHSIRDELEKKDSNLASRIQEVNALVETQNSAIADTKETTRLATEATAETKQATEDTKQATEQTTKATRLAKEATTETKQATELTKSATGELNKALTDTREATRLATEATEQTKQATVNTTEATRLAKKATEQTKQATELTKQATEQTKQATEATKQATTDCKEATEKAIAEGNRCKTIADGTGFIASNIKFNNDTANISTNPTNVQSAIEGMSVSLNNKFTELQSGVETKIAKSQEDVNTMLDEAKKSNAQVTEDLKAKQQKAIDELHSAMTNAEAETIKLIEVGVTDITTSFNADGSITDKGTNLTRKATFVGDSIVESITIGDNRYKRTTTFKANGDIETKIERTD